MPLHEITYSWNLYVTIQLYTLIPIPLCSFYDFGAFDPQLTNAGLIIVDNVVMFTSAKGRARLSPINNIAQYYM